MAIACCYLGVLEGRDWSALGALLTKSWFWSRGYKGSEAHYTPTEKEIVVTYEGVRAASEVVSTEVQFLLAPRLPVLGWMFKERVPSTHHATDATWSKWVAPITQGARMGNPSRPGILEVIMDWPEGKDFGASPEEEVTCAEEAPRFKCYSLAAAGIKSAMQPPLPLLGCGAE